MWERFGKEVLIKRPSGSYHQNTDVNMNLRNWIIPQFNHPFLFILLLTSHLQSVFNYSTPHFLYPPLVIPSSFYLTSIISWGEGFTILYIISVRHGSFGYICNYVVLTTVSFKIFNQLLFRSHLSSPKLLASTPKKSQILFLFVCVGLLKNAQRNRIMECGDTCIWFLLLNIHFKG